MAARPRSSKEKRGAGSDLRGATRLAVEATASVVDVAEAMHQAIGAGPAVLGRPLEGITRLLTGPVYGSVRAVAKLVGTSLDRALAALSPLLGEQVPGPEREALLAALNGVVGDHLVEAGNPLAIEMSLRRDGVPLELEPEALRGALPRAGRRRLLVLVHGSCLSDRQWTRQGHDHGAALERDRGFTAVYLFYNSGLHISVNGRALAALLERLVAAWPVPLDELVLLGHSMGGLVARSACHFGEAGAHAWRRKLRKLVCLGSPHHGAPLERGGGWVDLLLGVSRYSAPLARVGKLRSAGVTDLRFGNVLDEHWEGLDRFGHRRDARTPLPLPAGVQCYAIAGSRGASGRTLPGDGLVPVDSALGRHRDPDLALAFPKSHQWVAAGAAHLDLLDRADVYRKLRTWLSPSRRPGAGNRRRAATKR